MLIYGRYLFTNLCVYICSCMGYIHLCVCMCVCSYRGKYLHVCMLKYRGYLLIHLCICMYVCSFMGLFMCLCVGMLTYGEIYLCACVWVCSCMGKFNYVFMCGYAHVLGVCVYLCMSDILTLPIPSRQGLFLILGLVFSLPGWKPTNHSDPISVPLSWNYLIPGLLHGCWDQNSGPQDFVVSTHNLWATSPALILFSNSAKIHSTERP